MPFFVFFALFTFVVDFYMFILDNVCTVNDVMHDLTCHRD